ncbi:Gfo/Idh/MocA family oxidoreductase [Clostridium sp. YIM B02515]|uniref:Gfo/Idh/MocA family oxidoreductase n=1 Tax=Clostridium rhizosphaerae TaxID=2803861 RepID=A0ABS1T5K2_9CLOT|nr:Gfo/Idh/MocA family oxidoreductase [Clostridium rhizosphaerae]MBL4934618.1 Gfo/Idh/MocA family oxidoreductase [Clostridium rhizosphaerae]
MKKVTAVLLGAGQRGAGAYAPYAIKFPEELQFVAVAEPDKERREEFKRLHKIEDRYCFESWEELMEQPKLADAILICTQDRMHYEPTIKALEKGYHVLLEKPMSYDAMECVSMGEYAKKYNRVFSICHVLRYTPFFRTIKKLLEDGRIGKLMSIQQIENVAYWHQAHSFVRGNWRNSKESSPMILAKSCHDMDIILWLVGENCSKISSFGSLGHFKKEEAPAGAPLRCLDGCPAEKECPYYAPKIYIDWIDNWQADVIRKVVSIDTSEEALLKALKEGPYGRCVYHCDNDVVDHQVVNMEFENGVTAVFTMCAFTYEGGRSIKLMGTKGQIRCDLDKNVIEVRSFVTGKREDINLDVSADGHGGGDLGIMRDFVELVRNEGKVEGVTSASVSVQSHIMSLAAERSRLENKIINVQDYINELKKEK